LLVWQKAMDLTAAVYQAATAFPKDEIYGLTAQLRRAAVSVPSNVAEGRGRHSTPDFLNFLAIAHGSLCEVETQLLLAERLGYLLPRNLDPLMQQAAEVGRMLNGLMSSLRAPAS